MYLMPHVFIFAFVLAISLCKRQFLSAVYWCQHKKAATCLLEKIGVLVKFHSCVSHSAVCEVSVNESTTGPIHQRGEGTLRCACEAGLERAKMPPVVATYMCGFLRS